MSGVDLKSPEAAVGKEDERERPGIIRISFLIILFA